MMHSLNHSHVSKFNSKIIRFTRVISLYCEVNEKNGEFYNCADFFSLYSRMFRFSFPAKNKYIEHTGCDTEYITETCRSESLYHMSR